MFYFMIPLCYLIKICLASFLFKKNVIIIINIAYKKYNLFQKVFFHIDNREYKKKN